MRAPIEERLTIVPERRARMPGSTALIVRDGAEEVGLEQGSDVGVVALLDRGAVAVAGVVHQDVDAAEARPRPRGPRRRPARRR